MKKLKNGNLTVLDLLVTELSPVHKDSSRIVDDILQLLGLLSHSEPVQVECTVSIYFSHQFPSGE